MFTVKNGIYKSVTIDWANVTLPLKEGSPVSAAGVVANTADAIGIVPQTVSVIPVIPEIYVLVGGDVILSECEAAYGSTYAEAAVSAMDGIRFGDTDGTPVENSEVAKIKANVMAIEPDAIIKEVYDETYDAYVPVLTYGTYESLAAKIVDIADDVLLNVVYGNALLADCSAEEGYISLTFAVPGIDNGEVVWSLKYLYVSADGSVSYDEPSSDDSGNDESAPT